jgi:hypothetical protein
MSIDKTSAAYLDGRRQEEARIGARVRAALDARIPNLADIAREVGKQLGRDNGHKQRIWQRSPHVFSSMDAEELGQASARELAARELKELGIDFGDHDPVAILDAHHGGRQYARDRSPADGGPIMGGKPDRIFNPLGSSHDASEGTGNQSLDKYLKE